MLKVIDKYSDFGGWDNSDQSPLFLLLVILGWAIAQVCVCGGGGSWGTLPAILPPNWSGTIMWDKGKPRDS
jgi:hypothetical protein